MEAQSVVFYESRRFWEPQILRELVYRVGPLKEPCSRASSRFGDSGGCLETLEAGSDECLEDRVPGELHLSYFKILGGSGGSTFLRP